MNPESSGQYKKVTFFLPHIGSGGVAKVFLCLAEEFANAGHTIDLVVTELSNTERERIPSNINCVVLNKDKYFLHRLNFAYANWRGFKTLFLSFLLPIKASKAQKYFFHYLDYLDTAQPDVLLSAKPHSNIISVLAALKCKNKPRIILTEHTALSLDIATRNRKLRWKYLLPTIKKYYPCADKIVTVSKCVESDLLSLIQSENLDTMTIYNPIPIELIRQKMHETISHPWLNQHNIPVVLSAGRLEQQKDYPTLLRAFRIARDKSPMKLIILGEGKLKHTIQKMISDLSLEDDVDLAGFVNNPFAYMYQSNLFVLSSLWEGFGNVLVEALACGCQIISTDCKCGPREILDGGRHGKLIPTSDPELLAAEICNTIGQTTNHSGVIDKYDPKTIYKQYYSVCAA